VVRTHWHDRWDEGRIGFHREDVNPHLVRFASRLPKGRVYVPLAGKTHDLWFLAEQGFEPTGVEFVPRAVEQFFAEAGVTPSRSEGDAWVGGGVTVTVGDFFTTTHPPFDAVWDRAALIAIEPERRPEYVRQLASQMRSGAALLLVSLDYDPSRMDGPPFALTDAQVRELFATDFDAERLLREPADLPPRAREAGITGEESIWLLRRR